MGALNALNLLSADDSSLTDVVIIWWPMFGELLEMWCWCSLVFFFFLIANSTEREAAGDVSKHFHHLRDQRLPDRQAAGHDTELCLICSCALEELHRRPCCLQSIYNSESCHLQKYSESLDALVTGWWARVDGFIWVVMEKWSAS